MSLTMIKSKISSKKLLGSGVTSKHTPTMHAMIITLRHASSNLLTDWNIQCALKDRDVLTTLLEEKKPVSQRRSARSPRRYLCSNYTSTRRSVITLIDGYVHLQSDTKTEVAIEQILVQALAAR